MKNLLKFPTSRRGVLGIIGTGGFFTTLFGFSCLTLKNYNQTADSRELVELAQANPEKFSGHQVNTAYSNFLGRVIAVRKLPEGPYTRLIPCDGVPLQVRIMGKDGAVIHHPDDLGELDPGSDITKGDLEKLLIEPNPEANKHLQINNKYINTILVQGDSFIEWGGSIYSVATFLQDLLNSRGYNTRVRSAGVTNTGIINHIEVAKKLGKVTEPDLTIVTVQPDTDFFSDMDIYDMNLQEQIRYFKRLGYGAITLSTKLEMIINSSRQTANTLRREVSDVLPIDSVIEKDDKGNIISAKGILRPLTDQEGLTRYLRALKYFVNQNKGQTLVLGTPPMGVYSNDDLKAYHTRIWNQIEGIVNEDKSVDFLGLHAEMKMDKDRTDHPTPRACLVMAIKIFEKLTGESLSQADHQKAWENYQKRKEYYERVILPKLRAMKAA
jgi:hypothetical protein